jgi:hypothetical protein
MGDITVVIRTADQTRNAEVSMSAENTGADVINASVSNWSLPADTDYTLVNASSGKAIQPRESLDANGVKSGDILEIQPVLVAG